MLFFSFFAQSYSPRYFSLSTECDRLFMLLRGMLLTLSTGSVSTGSLMTYFLHYIVGKSQCKKPLCSTLLLPVSPPSSIFEKMLDLAGALSTVIGMGFLLKTWLPSPVQLLIHHYQRQRELPQFLPRRGHYHSY